MSNTTTAIPLGAPGQDSERDPLTPQQVVEELDRYIIGQGKAKRAVAIALRNRWRRKRVPEDLRNEIAPKNIIMIGPTGVGKTEVARRLAKLTKSPFIKVEATKFTEVGYVGRDVESMIRDLVDIAINQVKQEMSVALEHQAKEAADRRIVEALLLSPSSTDGPKISDHTREALLRKVSAGEFDSREVEIEVKPSASSASIDMFSNMGNDQINMQLSDMFSGLMNRGKKEKRKVSVSEARRLILQEETEKLLDMNQVKTEALQRVEQDGIVFLDEIDKVAKSDTRTGSDVSREGVQRDILPIVEGSSVTTKHGIVNTDHIMFIAAGAFHMSKPSDLIPELQGRFPVRVELDALTADDFFRILTEPDNSLVRQYTSLLETEGVTLTFTEPGLKAIARYAQDVNDRTENIGARRLHTIMEVLVEEISFHAPNMQGQTIDVTPEFVEQRVEPLASKDDLSRYML